ncbi:melanocyte-stimulating hormone receptor-like [Penaeus japonicus]|uniref:melanocyte-stimulating hormone receptor-like n=1 Tax=Penaeus japonicus TaxID=27405 RepID=UPI001C70CBFD|nr:melanocyte-stimulating hormone receptor-like [Penaeus japonicus]
MSLPISYTSQVAVFYEGRVEVEDSHTGVGGCQVGANVTRESGLSVPLEVYLVPSGVTVLGCALALYVTLRGKVSQQRQETTSLILSLVVSIFLLSSLSLAYQVVLLTLPDVTLRDPSACYVKLFQRTLSAVFSFSLAGVALDRYLALCWPLRYYDLLTRPRSLLLVACSWLAPILLVLLACLQDPSALCCDSRHTTATLATYAALYGFGGSLTVFLNGLVATEFRRTRSLLHLGNEAAAFDKQARRRTTLSALLAATLCFLSIPHIIVPLLPPRLLPVILIRIVHLLHRVHVVLFLPVYVKNTFKAVCDMLATCFGEVWSRCWAISWCRRSPRNGEAEKLENESV